MKNLVETVKKKRSKALPAIRLLQNEERVNFFRLIEFFSIIISDNGKAEDSTHSMECKTNNKNGKNTLRNITRTHNDNTS